MKNIILVLFLAGITTGCGNIYSFIDSPSGDLQNLSKARACFDKGDYPCAAKHYALLSSSYSDTAYSESAFQITAQNGAGVGPFVSSVLAASGDGGKLITKLVSYMASGAGQTARLAILHAYQSATHITNTKSQGLVEFITATALVAELLSENASNGIIQQTDIVVNATTCLAASPLYNVAACDSPSGKAIVQGSALSTLTITSSTPDSDFSGSPSLYMINAALTAISTGITKMNPTGSGAGSAASGFASTVLAAGTTAIGNFSGRPYRAVLVQNNIGVNP